MFFRCLPAQVSVSRQTSHYRKFAAVIIGKSTDATEVLLDLAFDAYLAILHTE